MNKVDQEWLDALAGKNVGPNESLAQIEATAVRHALIARRNSIEQEIENFDPIKFEAFKAKLIKQRLLKTESKSVWKKLMAIVLGASNSSSSLLVAQRFGLAVTVIAVGLALNMSYSPPKNDDAMVFRGDATVTYIIDEKVDQKLNELISGLNIIKAEFTQEQQSYGKTLLKIKSTYEVLTFLSEKRIEPKVIDGYISIVVSPPNAQGK